MSPGASGKEKARQLVKVILLASGEGTNAEALMTWAQKNSEKIKIVALVSDRAEAGALQRAKNFGVPTHVIAAKDEVKLLQVLRDANPEWACLAGYMRLVSANFLQFFADEENFFRVLNIHPSLLPEFPGLHGYRRAFEAGVKESGVTVHLVDQGLDTGMIVLQEKFSRLPADTLNDFESRGRVIEQKLYPVALQQAVEGKIHLHVKRERGSA